MDSFEDAIDKVSFLSETEIEEINAQIKKMEQLSQNYDWTQAWPQLSRDCGANILHYITFKNVDKVVNHLNFAADSLFCEWAYVVDLDKKTFEIYEGFNKTELNPDDRFFFLEHECAKKYENGYHPVKILKSYNLDDLPTLEQFLNELENF